MTSNLESGKYNLTNCDKEPIQIIGSVQAHGYFLAFRLVDQTIYHASENIVDLLGKPARELLDRPLGSFLAPAVVSRIVETAKKVGPGEPEHLRLRDLTPAKSTFELYLYELDGLIAIEFEEHATATVDDLNVLTASHKRSQNFVETLHACENLATASNLCCRAIRDLIGFDRVMMYQYLPNWDGEVIAEDKSPEAHSFFGHRFPATDIPLPARELYLKNRTRLIVDSAGKTSPILPRDHYLTRKPVDLSHSKLRAVSPIHLEYLKNMGVKASFSVAVIVNRQLWGLIACHGNEPTVIPQEIRMSCESIAATFGALAKMIEERTRNSIRLNFDARMRSLFQTLIGSHQPLKKLFQQHAVVEELFSATGIAMVGLHDVQIAGLTPPLEETKEIAAQLRARFVAESKTVISIDSLQTLEKKWKDLSILSCGVLAVYTPDSDESVFLIFRPELLRTITWGGDPQKTMQKRNYGGQINPRVSFESWTETVSGHSDPWTSYEIQGAAFMRDFVFENLLKRDRLIEQLGQQLQLNKN